MSNHQAAVLLALCSHFLERFEPLALVLAASRYDRVASRFEVIVLYHQVARQDVANGTLSPSPVDVDQVL